MKKNGTKNKADNTIKIRKFLYHTLSMFTGLFFIGFTLLLFLWLMPSVHPGIGSEDNNLNGNKINIPERVDTYSENMKIDILSSYLENSGVMKKIYRIEEGNLAPKPHEECYGSVSLENIEEMDAVIDRARDMGLLEGQDMAFSTSANFYKCTVKYYLDETILVILWKELINDKVICFAEVKVADASQFGRKLVNDTYGSEKQMFASDLCKQANAVVGMNADYYAFRSLGLTCYDGTVYRTEDSLDTLFIDRNGDFIFYDKKQNKTKEEIQQYVDDNNIKFGLSFGPVMIRDGEIVCNGAYPIGQTTEIYSRAGIGQMDHLHYLFVNVENYGEYKPPCTVNDYAPIMLEKGVVNGYNLDGGQTAEVVFEGKFYNFVDYGNERDVSDIIFFASALPESEGR